MRTRRRTWTPVGILALITAFLGACGGGGGGSGITEPPPTVFVYAVDPPVAYGEERTDVTITGLGFAAGEDTATVRFTATVGTPFSLGSSDVLALEGTVVSDTEITARIPRTHVPETALTRCSVELSNGDVGGSADPLLTVEAQVVTAITPSDCDGSKTHSLQVIGNGFHPVGETASIFLYVTSGGPFHSGMTSSTNLHFSGQITSSTTIAGLLPYAGVEVDTQTQVTVSLPSGASFGSNDGPVFHKGTAGVRGRWTYDRVPCASTGLDYAGAVEMPIRGAVVLLVDRRTGQAITARDLSDDGDYEIDFGMDDEVFVRVLAQTREPRPPITVHENVGGTGTWAADGETLTTNGQWQVRDYNVPCGWAWPDYDSTRASGPFAILDTLYGAAAQLYAERTLELDSLVVHWDPENRPESGNVDQGQIGTTHFDGQDIYVLGKQDVDTDEFDAPVLIHEWGHFLEATVGRSDSLGGPHYDGDHLEPTVAFSEGFCTALAAIMRYPDSTYVDTLGEDQASGWGVDVEDNTIDSTARGWFGEDSVSCIVYDLFDPAQEGAWDTVSLSVGTLYDTLADGIRNTPALTTIYVMIRDLLDHSEINGDDANAICNKNGVFSTIAWGTGETNDGGWSANLPVYTQIAIGTQGARCEFYGLADMNHLEANRKYYFWANGANLLITAETPTPAEYIDDHDILIWVTHDGEIIAAADDYWYGTESVTVNTDPNEWYVLNIVDLSAYPGTYTCTVGITGP